MEEVGMELIDYLRVLWKRKVFFVVGTLVCLVIGVVVEVSLRPPATYRAETLVRIGKALDPSAPPPSPPSTMFIDSLESLLITIPLDYQQAEKGYNLSVQRFNNSFLKIVMQGPVKGIAKECLNAVVAELIADHLRKTKSYIQSYVELKERLEEDNILIQKNMYELEERLENVNNEEFEHLIAALTQNNLGRNHINIRSNQNDIVWYKLAINSLEENKTVQIGKVAEIELKPNRGRKIMFAGGVGLMMSLFLAFVEAYMGNVRKMQEKRKKVDSV